MRKIILLLLMLAWLGTDQLQAQKLKKKSAWSGIKGQNLLASSEWSTTSSQQQKLAEFNGELAAESDQVTISYQQGNFSFNAASGPGNSFSVDADFEKTELGVVYFVPKNEKYSRITVHKKDKLIVVERVDHSMVCYHYSEIQF